MTNNTFKVRELARAEFLRPAGRRRKRNMIEQRYIATAHAYVLAPPLLGPLGAEPAHVADAFSAERLLAVASRLQHELAGVVTAAAEAGRRLSTLSITADIRFESAAHRTEFAAALQQAIVDVIGRFAAPTRPAGGPASGRMFRLVAGCYPKPAGARADRSPGGAPERG